MHICVGKERVSARSLNCKTNMHIDGYMHTIKPQNNRFLPIETLISKIKLEKQ